MTQILEKVCEPVVFLKSLVMACYGYTIFLFCKRMFKQKFSTVITASAFLLYEALIDYQIIGRLVRNYFLSVGLSQCGIILLMGLLLKGSIVNKLAISTVIFTVQELASYFVESLFIMSIFAMEEYKHIALPEWFHQSMGLVRYLICCILLYFISYRCCHLHGITTSKSSLLMLIPSIFIILAIETAFFVFHEVQLFQTLQHIKTGSNNFGAYIFDAVFLLLISAAGLLANLTIIFGVNHSIRQEFIQGQQSFQIKHYQALHEQHKQIVSIKHDIKNHNTALWALAEAGKLDELKQYLSRMIKSSGMGAHEILTGNEIVDAIINEKAAIARKCGITFSCDTKFPRLNFMSDYDLCVIFGNTLDNALEACDKCEIGHRFIHMQSSVVKSYFLCEIKNSMVPGNASLLRSSKKNRQLHGLGLNHVRSTVTKYHGTMHVSTEGDQFCLSLMLPL